MRGWGLAVALAMLAAGPAAAQMSVLRGEQACVTVALKQLMIHRKTLGWVPLRDSRGRVIGTVFRMEVKFLGKSAEITCIHDEVKPATVIEFGRGPGTAPGAVPAPAAEVVLACRRAAQADGVIVERVVSESTVRNRLGQPVGRTVVMNGRWFGKAVQARCDYDYATRRTSVQVGRPEQR